MSYRFREKYFICLLAAMMHLSCRHNTVIPPDTKPLSFNNDIAPILVSNCASCHTHQGTGERSFTPDNDFNRLDTNKLKMYIQAGDPGQSQLYTSITSLASPMPPTGPMPEGDIIQIFLWIKEGANYSN